MRINVLALLFFLYSCSSDKVPISSYKAKNIIVVVMDGARYSETWGSSDHALIPYMDSVLSSEGVIYSNFENNGFTYTSSGHVSITTGYNQEIDNTGADIPSNPSFFQLWLKQTMNQSSSAWIVASKDKLEVLANCKTSKWKNKYQPSVNCGINGSGVGSGYRDDSLTMIEVMNVLNQHEPELLLINLKEPDFSGHTGNWQAYTEGVKKSDYYVYQLWNFIQEHPKYKNSTAFFVTNDHGRHSDNVNVGFSSHGDNCDGCKHIFLYASGPDFHKNKTFSTSRNLRDLNATIQELLQLKARSTDGNLMIELFSKH